MLDHPTEAAAYTVVVDGRKVLDSADSANVDAVSILRRWMPVGLAVVLSAVAIVLIVAAWSSYRGPAWLAIPLQLVGLSYLLGGAALWVHRPGNYLGPVSVLLGATWYLGDLQAFDHEILFVLGFAGYHLNVVVFAHLALMVPSGRLVGRLDHFVVAALYLMVPTTQLLRYVEVRPYIDRTTFGDVTAYYSTWARVATYLGLPLALAAAALVVGRFRGAKPVQRRSFGLFWIAAAAVGLAAAAASILESFSPLSQQIALLGYSVAMVTASLGLVVGAINVTASDFNAWERLATDVIDLERAIATAAGDPDLRFYTYEQHVWRRGSTVLDRVPAAGLGGAQTRLSIGGQPVALLVHDRELAYQRPLVQAIATMTLAALARLRLTRERNEAAVDAQQAERSRIGRDLHDGVQAVLATVVRGVDRTAGRLPADHPEKGSLAEIADDVEFLQTRLTQIMRNVYPLEIAEVGLGAAVRTLLRSIDAPQHGIEIDVDVVDRRPAGDERVRVEVEAYFIISEALQNSLKHSTGTHVWISAEETEHALLVSVDDNGTGWSSDRAGRTGNGLANMAARVELLNGSISLGDSEHGGVKVAAVLPLPPEKESTE